MKVAVITNFNGRGLERDAEGIDALVARAGHESARVPWKYPISAHFDLAIFLEVAPLHLADLAPRRWFVPNPEWWEAEGHGRWMALDNFERILCKTREAYRAFSEMTRRATYSGFASRDRLDISVPRERRFLCVAGVSVAKGADAVIKAWELLALPHRLDVVGKLFEHHAPVPNVAFRGHVDDATLRVLQNACMFHVQPSWTEGFGVTTHESLSCGALLATTEAPPMDELPAAAFIPPSGMKKMRAATAYRCRPQEVAEAIRALTAMSDEQVSEVSSLSRAYYESSRRDFETRFLALLD